MSDEIGLDDNLDDDVDKNVVQLVRRAGPRDKLPDPVRDRLEARFRDEMDKVARRRRVTRRTGLLAAAASILVAVGALVIMPADEQAVRVAAVSASTGAATWRDGESSGPARAGTILNSGDEIHTGDGMLLLELSSGVQVRLRGQTRVQLTAADRLRLEAGAVYVDSGGDAAHGDLIVAAAGLDVSHVGTQYLVRIEGEKTWVAVREGAVSVAGGDHDLSSVRADAGEVMTFEGTRLASRAPVASHGETWAWVNGISPRFDVGGRSPAEILEWAARETGREVVYASPDARAIARSASLQGNYAVTTETAFDVLASANLVANTGSAPDDGMIRVSLLTEPR